MALVVLIIVGVVFLICFFRFYDKLKSIVEKILYLLAVVVYFSPLLLYYIDYYDWGQSILKGVDMERWFDFMSSYVGIVVGIIGNGLILYLVTMYQSRAQAKDNEENRRLQFYPIFTYEAIGKTKNDKLELSMTINNVGLGTARNIRTNLITRNMKENTISEKKVSDLLKVDDNVVCNMEINLNKESTLENEVIVRVLYDDLLNNTYSQDIIVKKKLSVSSGSEASFIFSGIEVAKEELIN